MKRSQRNPILTRADIPDVPPDVVDPSSEFNPGAVFFDERYFLLLRVQTRGREIVLRVAESAEGERFTVRPEIVRIAGLETVGERIYHVYDPRLTRLDEAVYVVFAADTDGSCRLAIARTQDMRRFELVGYGRDRDVRNGVLFPERFGGRYLRLERPNRRVLDGGVTSGSEIVLSESDDLVAWRELGPVMSGRWRYWDEMIGSGPPPVKTRQGWLHVYHGVATHFAAANIYQAGVALLDLADPSRLLARSHDNVLEPREMYEMVGQVPNVIFPSGMIVEAFDAEGFAEPSSLVRLYDGAADTVVAMATTTITELLGSLYA